MKKKSSKQNVWKMSLALGVLALALSACGGNDKDDKNNASPSASPSASATESASSSPSESPSASPSASAPAEASDSSSADVTAGFKLFEDKANGTSIQYPEDWTLQENVAGTIAAFLSPQESDNDKFQENVNIVVQDLGGEEITLEQYAEVSIQSVQQLITDAKIITSEAIQAEDGSDFYNLLYSGKQGEFELNWQQVFTISNGKAYVMTYTAEPNSFDTFVEKVSAMGDTWTIN